MVLLHFTLMWLLTCDLLFQTIVILSQTIVISFDILPSLVQNSKKFNYDWGILLTRSLFILLILSPSQFIQNHTYPILCSRLLNCIREPLLLLWLHNVQLPSPIAFIHISTLIPNNLIHFLRQSVIDSFSLNPSLLAHLHSHWINISIPDYSVTIHTDSLNLGHSLIALGRSTISIHNKNALSHKTVIRNHCGVYWKRKIVQQLSSPALGAEGDTPMVPQWVQL